LKGHFVTNSYYMGAVTGGTAEKSKINQPKKKPRKKKKRIPTTPKTPPSKGKHEANEKLTKGGQGDARNGLPRPSNRKKKEEKKK